MKSLLYKTLSSIGDEIRKSAKNKIASYYETFPDRRTCREQWRDMAIEAKDKSWSTAKTPNPNAYQFQDNCIIKLVKRLRNEK